MEHPQVKVTKLERRPDGSVGPEAKLGAVTDEQFVIQANATGLLRHAADRAKEIYLLEWEGGKVPRGTVINGRVINWTQHGVITDDEGIDIGVYERTVEFGGESKREQKMIAFIS